MHRNLIEERKQKLERQKEKLKHQEAYLKQLERKSRTRKLIEFGGIVAKSKLDNLSPETLYGAMISLRRQMDSDKDIVEEWTQTGKDMFNAENKDKTAVIVSFKQKPTAEIRSKIREEGLKWNQFRKEWHGHVHLSKLKEIVDGDKVEIQKVER